ncbi:MAG: hypothetical protein Q8L08_11350 [Candidatus Nanopelagicaceae bacterium]|nr:hypothetical protein [Candidatus Nanopelagicaceae bacterium]
MAITSNTIALFSIGSSAVVAIAGILVPTWVHISDRRHEAKLRLADKREITYLKLSHVISAARRPEHDKALTLAGEMVGLMSIWPTEIVRTLFFEWLELLPTAFGPDKSDAQDKIVQEAGEALRKRMAAEVQMTD